MIKKVYEEIGKDYGNIINKLRFYYESIKDIVMPSIKNVWNVYVPTSKSTSIKYVAVDGGMFMKSIRTGTVYVVNAEALLYTDNKSTPLSTFSKVGVFQPGNLDKERVDTLMEIGELKVALESAANSDILLMDGSIKKKAENLEEVIQSNQPLELIEQLDTLTFNSEKDMLIYLLSVKESLLNKLVSSYSNKLLWISKNSKSRDLVKKYISDKIEISDVSVLEAFTSEPGYSLPLLSEVVIGDKIYSVVTTYIRLCKGCKVLRVDIVIDSSKSFNENDIRGILDSLEPSSVEGYPYPLIKVHSDVKVNKEDRKRILNILGFNTLPSAHWWPRQFL